MKTITNKKTLVAAIALTLAGINILTGQGQSTLREGALQSKLAQVDMPSVCYRNAKLLTLDEPGKRAARDGAVTLAELKSGRLMMASTDQPEIVMDYFEHKFAVEFKPVGFDRSTGGRSNYWTGSIDMPEFKGSIGVFSIKGRTLITYIQPKPHTGGKA